MVAIQMTAVYFVNKYQMDVLLNIKGAVSF